MSYLDFLPLGSVVELKGEAKRKAVIISRGLAYQVDGVKKFFDYGGCLYPDGLFSNHIMYFNREDIKETIFNGFSDEADKVQVDAINKWIDNNHMERGSVSELKKKRQEKK